ncbi:MAG TPA: Hsp20/alpha crystallin family protein [Gaiellaceae bacterium]|nr:Hsp20/alpha crystallin family protein [Gaiellaceae bacterium]
MTLVRWNPLQELDAMERRMRRIFDETGIVPAPLPAADVYETDAEFVYELEVPGFEEEQLAVEVTDHTLTVKGERTEHREEEDKAFRLQERLARKFERRFELPVQAKAEKLAAEFKDGVLTVHAPKTKAATPHKVAITAK